MYALIAILTAAVGTLAQAESKCDNPDRNSGLIELVTQSLSNIEDYRFSKIEIQPDYGRADRQYDNEPDRGRLFMQVRSPILKKMSSSEKGQDERCSHSPEVHLTFVREGTEEKAVCLLALTPFNGSYLFKLGDCQRFTVNSDLAAKLNRVENLN